MAKFLSIDASTEACSVALQNGDEITERYQLAPRQHANLLLPMVEELLAESQLSINQLDALACQVGPGVRIAVSVAQGLAYGADLPTISLSSLANLAHLGHSKTGNNQWLCAIDARMHEVYYAKYVISQSNVAVLSEQELVIPPSSVVKLNSQQGDIADYGLIGSGWQAYSGELLISSADQANQPAGSSGLFKPANLLENCYPSAKHGLAQALYHFDQSNLLEPAALQPIYLRNNVAVKKMVK